MRDDDLGPDDLDPERALRFASFNPARSRARATPVRADRQRDGAAPQPEGSLKRSPVTAELAALTAIVAELQNQVGATAALKAETGELRSEVVALRVELAAAREAREREEARRRAAAWPGFGFTVIPPDEPQA